MQVLKSFLVLACCLAAVSGQATNYNTLAAAVSAANASAPNLSILLAAVEAAGVGSSLTNDTAWTILAPTNEAFTSRLDAELGITPQQLLLPENKDTLIKVLSYHVIPEGAVNSSQLTDGQEVATALEGADPLTVSINNGTVTFEGATTSANVTVPDIKAGASVIHVINDVLLPAADDAEEVPTANSTAGPPAAAPTPAAPGAAAAPAPAPAGSSAAGLVSNLFWVTVAFASLNALL